ncbi:MAG: FHA domain-containing protein, partial [Planctomycetaceae bacterium]|nr:FHA domain-containing protein [Planctomycetaceae bacterium]
MSKLVLLQAGEATPYELTSAETVLGRHPECGIQLQSNMVSRRHATVRSAGDGKYTVEDLGSGNGTFVNGSRIEQPTELKHYDRIKLGPILLRYESDDGTTTSTGSVDLGNRVASRPGHTSTVDIPGLPASFGRKASKPPLDETMDDRPAFQLDVTDDTVQGTDSVIQELTNESGFGLLDSQPE